MSHQKERQQENDGLRETFNEFTDSVSEKNVEVVRILKMYIDWLLMSPKNRRILHDVHQHQDVSSR